MSLQKATQFFGHNDFAAAEQQCRAALEQTPDHPPALNLMAGICARTGRLPEAIGWMERACDNAPGNHEFWANLGRLYRFGGRPEQAINVFIKAVNLAPDNREYKEALIALLETMQFPEFSPSARDALLACLRDDRLNLQTIALAWHSLIDTDPDLAPLIALKEHESYEAFRAAADRENLPPLLGGEFLLRGLQHCIVISPPFEKLLTHLRRYFLEQAAAGHDVQPVMPFLCALAAYCFLTEYVFYVGDAEKDLLERIDTVQYPAVAACYRALYLCAEPDKLLTALTRTQNDSLAALAREQLAEPLHEKELRDAIPSLTEIENATSKAVRAQYEENPYPRWKTLSVEEYRRRPGTRGAGKTILNAGCGTGQEPISNALYYSDAQMTAIDLSRASMAYAARKAEELGVTNISFLHADILSVEKIGRPFDFIVSSGVLHHMKDPAAGLRALKGVLAPGGVMKIGLYSTIARRHISACRAWIVRQGYQATAEDIRAFRREMFATAAQTGFMDIVGMKDFYSLSQCRDLLFHVQEHTFTCLELRDLIDAENLRLLYFDVAPAVRQEYARLFPQDPAQTDLALWHSYETERQDTFLSMYGLWLGRKEDYADAVLPAWIMGR